MRSYEYKFRVLRKNANLTQTEIANLLGISQSTYSKYESSAASLPIQHLFVLCKFYKVSADYILGFTNRPDPYRK